MGWETMNKLYIYLPIYLPIIILAAIYIFILVRKGEFPRFSAYLKSNDWMTFFGVIFASTILSRTLRALDVYIIPKNIALLSFILMQVALIVFVAIIVFLRIRAGKPIIKRGWDERTKIIIVKSARNALFATYLTFFIHELITESYSLDTLWYAITLAGGLLVLIVSIFIYYFRTE